MKAVNQRNFASVADYRASVDQHPCKPAYRSDTIAPTESAREHAEPRPVNVGDEYQLPAIPPEVLALSEHLLSWLLDQQSGITPEFRFMLETERYRRALRKVA